MIELCAGLCVLSYQGALASCSELAETRARRERAREQRETKRNETKRRKDEKRRSLFKRFERQQICSLSSLALFVGKATLAFAARSLFLSFSLSHRAERCARSL